MTEFQHNAPQDVEKNIEKIIQGEAIARKPSKLKRLRQSFIAGDATSVGDYIFWNVLVPSTKDVISDFLSTFVDMMIYGEKRQRYGPSGVPSQGFGSTSRVNYGSISSGNRIVLGPPQNNPTMEPVHVRFSPNEIIVPTRHEAEDIIKKMFEVLEKYNAVTVSDLYRMVGISPEYTDQNWGWTNLDSADVKRVSEGVLLVLPVPQDLR